MELITFETAKLAKEKGFNEWCVDGFINNEHIKKYHVSGDSLEQWRKYDAKSEFTLLEGCTDFLIPRHEPWYKAPSQTELEDWLRKKHNIFIEIQIDKTTDPKFCYEIYKYTYFGNWELISKRPEMFLTMDWYKNKEDALQEALNQI